MKKLILLLLFIPLVSFGQDEEGSGLDKVLKQSETKTFIEDISIAHILIF